MKKWNGPIAGLSLIALLCLAACGDKESPTNATAIGRPDTHQNPSQPVGMPNAMWQVLGEANAEVPQALDAMNAWPLDSLPPSLSDTNYEIYSVTLLWGPTAPPDPDLIGIFWNGMLSVNGVAVIHITNAISFEDPSMDYLIPYDNPAISGWASYTRADPTPDYDGITCLIFLDKRATYITAPWLTLDTGPIDTTWQFSELENLTAWYPAGDNAGLAIHARRIYFNGCPRGLIDGEWTRAPFATDSGGFNGLWYDHNSAPSYTIAGQYWTTNDGQRKWEGTISGLITTQVVGWIEGTWAYDDARLCPVCGQSYGYMVGNFRWDNENAWSGKIAARFGSPEILPQDSVLTFHGGWKENCRNSDKWGLVDLR